MIQERENCSVYLILYLEVIGDLYTGLKRFDGKFGSRLAVWFPNNMVSPLTSVLWDLVMLPCDFMNTFDSYFYPVPLVYLLFDP